MCTSGISSTVAIEFNDTSLDSNDESQRDGLITHGKPGYQLSTLDSISDCTDAALSFINCDAWLSERPSDGDFKGTTVIIDDALSVDEWTDLEDDEKTVSLDVIRYVTADSNGNPVEFGSSGQDSLIGVSDSDLGSVNGHNHGHKVLSVYAQIAEDSNVIFINVDTSDGTGFKTIYKISTVWNWIYNHKDTYDIEVVSMSVSRPDDANGWDHINSAINDLYNAGIYMVGAIGNDGQYRGDHFPVQHQYVYGIGSVDHEDRGKLVRTYNEFVYLWEWDEDYYSNKGGYSGSAQDAQEHQTKCYDPSETPFCSSYGKNQAGHEEAMDFVMPGYGVPVKSEDFQTFYYDAGTSYSTPYIAATAIVAVYAYNQGHAAAGGGYQDPSASTIHYLLKGASSRSSHSQRMGFGYIDLLELHNEAYSSGYNPATPDRCPDYPLC